MMNVRNFNNSDRESTAAPTILVVDDEVLIRMVVGDYLRDCGYRVIEAGDGDEALAVLSAPDVTVDVLFSDVQMPGAVDGFGLARWVRRERPGVPVVLTSGVARARDAAEALCADNVLVEKPYDAVDVERRLRRLLSSGR